MIIKGKSRSGPAALAAHLGNAEKNERVTLLETRGTVAQDLRGALMEMDAVAAGTRCEKPLYHAAISPGPPHRLTPEQREEAIDALEEKLYLTNHARVVVMHEKHGREHIHVVWSRIDLENMRSVSDSHNYRKHEEVARDLERRFDHERVQGAHHEREGVERPKRTPSRSELRQEERTGIKGKDVRREVTNIFRSSDGAEAFQAGLQEWGYMLAKGDKRDFIIVDRAGGTHSLARRIEGIKAAELREFMSTLDAQHLLSAQEAKELAEERARRQEELRESGEEAKLERNYTRGADYVSETTAALKEHKTRQRAIDEDVSLSRFDKIELSEEEHDDSQQHLERIQAEKRRSASSDDVRPTKKRDSGALSNVEMTDRMQRLLSSYDYDARETDQTEHEHDAGPGRQQEAPGGGHTRSR